MSIRPEEDSSYFDEFVTEDVRKKLHNQQCAEDKNADPEAEKDCFEGKKEFVHPDEA